MTAHRILRRDERGGALVEFAISLPVLVSMIYGIFELCQLYWANAGIQHALGEGARYANLYDATTGNHVPAASDIKARMNARLFGPVDGTYTVSDPDVHTGYMTLTITYRRTMNFLLFPGPTITLTRSKTAYTVA